MQNNNLDPSKYNLNPSECTITEGTLSTEIYIRTKDGIVIILNKDTEDIVKVWLDNGYTHISVPKDISVEDTIECAKTHIRDGTVTCCNCGMIIPRLGDGVARHFSGVMCNSCWEKYKATHSRKCGICGRPLYECYC